MSAWRKLITATSDLLAPDEAQVEQGSPAELLAAGGHYAKLQAESERLA
jgi:ABC-type multidrug transport system fused ATPase/permease subunit